MTTFQSTPSTPGRPRPGTPPDLNTDARVRYDDMKACDAFAVMAQVKHITCPPLAIGGLDDVITPPEDAEYLRRTFPSAPWN